MPTQIEPSLVGLALLASAALLAACATTGNHVASWGEITLAPGDTGSCSSCPCAVYFEMPPGDGDYLVTLNQIADRRYPAGRKVMLGGFFESRSIRVPEADVPPAYVYIPNVR